MKFSSRGFTLIELLVGLAVALLILAGGIAMIMPISKASIETLRASKLNSEIQIVSHIIDNEIRRAGFTVAVGNSPQKVEIIGTDCLIYSYQEPGNSLSNWAGFKLQDQQVYSARNMTVKPADCTGSNWAPMTQIIDYQITKLIFECTNTNTIQTSLEAQSGDGTNYFRKQLNILSHTRNTECIEKP